MTAAPRSIPATLRPHTDVRHVTQTAGGLACGAQRVDDVLHRANGLEGLWLQALSH